MPTIKVTSGVKREIERYRGFMLEHEYTTQTTNGYVTYLSRFLRWAEVNHRSCLDGSITEFLAEQRETCPKTYKECRAAVYQYYRMVTGKSFPARIPLERDGEIEAIIKRFCDYSINVKRIRPNSVKREVATIRDFLEHVKEVAHCPVERITAHEIRHFACNCLSHLKDSSKGRDVTSIRNFFRFLKFTGIPVHESVFLLPLTPAVWKNSAFPTTMDDCVFDNLYKIPDEKTPTGKRDRCILLFFTELALRCIEVATLTLDDFNWWEGFVAIKNTKNRSERKLPISDKLNQALIDYLRFSRPKTDNRVLFVRFKHVGGEPMGCEQIRGVVRRTYAKTGTDIQSTGTHILRRTAATKLYNAGNSLKMTADILGHESLDSTTRYAKVDIAGLGQVASPWPAMAGKAGVHDAE